MELPPVGPQKPGQDPVTSETSSHDNTGHHLAMSVNKTEGKRQPLSSDKRVSKALGERTVSSIMLAKAYLFFAGLFSGISDFVKESYQKKVVALTNTYLHQGDLSQAESLLEKVSATDPNQAIREWRSATYCRLAQEYQRAGYSENSHRTFLRVYDELLPEDLQPAFQQLQKTHEPCQAILAEMKSDNIKAVIAVDSVLPAQILVTGIAGSGKSHLVNQIAARDNPEAEYVMTEGETLDTDGVQHAEMNFSGTKMAVHEVTGPDLDAVNAYLKPEINSGSEATRVFMTQVRGADRILFCYKLNDARMDKAGRESLLNLLVAMKLGGHPDRSLSQIMAKVRIVLTQANLCMVPRSKAKTMDQESYTREQFEKFVKSFNEQLRPYGIELDRSCFAVAGYITDSGKVPADIKTVHSLFPDPSASPSGS